MKRYELKNAHYEFNIWEGENEDDVTKKYIESVVGYKCSYEDFINYCADVGIIDPIIEWKEL